MVDLSGVCIHPSFPAKSSHHDCHDLHILHLIEAGSAELPGAVVPPATEQQL